MKVHCYILIPLSLYGLPMRKLSRIVDCGHEELIQMEMVFPAQVASWEFKPDPRQLEFDFTKPFIATNSDDHLRALFASMTGMIWEQINRESFARRIFSVREAT
jgi:hypothetical protein